MDAVYAVMAARVAEEEQTQRTMIALNEMKPSYPGKGAEEVKNILDEVKWSTVLAVQCAITTYSNYDYLYKHNTLHSLTDQV